MDIIDFIYSKFICNPETGFHSSFTLSKGHAAVALYVVLNKYGFLTNADFKIGNLSFLINLKLFALLHIFFQEK